MDNAHKNEYRTHSCGELRILDIGKQVVLSGWISAIRKLGGIAFVVLRDHFGSTQLLFKDESKIEGLTRESVIKVNGVVVERQSKNPNMETGDIEVEVNSYELLS